MSTYFQNKIHNGEIKAIKVLNVLKIRKTKKTKYISTERF